jgi:glycosyltransferase involved in cell wall biosynthesis
VIHPCSRFSDSSAKGRRPAALNPFAPGEFWLNVGTVEPRKNQIRLLEAYSRYLEVGGNPMPLVLAGGKGWLMDDFNKHVSDLGLEGQILFTGYVSDDELIWLYRNCYANLYPSLFEGFGLPILEGMQFGAPTFCSSSTSMPEVGGDAAILLDPNDVEGWAQAMLELDLRKREQLSELSLKRAAGFSWQKSAGKLLQLYEEVCSSPKRFTV